MTIDQLVEKGAIYIKNIEDGFENFSYERINLTQIQAVDYFSTLWKNNGKDKSFVDFYYYRLNEDSKKKAESVLSKEEVKYLQSHTVNWDCIIFPLDETLLSIVIKLNASGMLFSTFYFLQPVCTCWGNYDQEYVVFRRK